MHNSYIPSLASQHHLSLYNRLRYGPQGSSVRYSPLSTTFPAHYHHLQLRQLQVAELQTAWHTSDKTPLDAGQHLADQLQAAIDEPFAPQSTIRLKTSMTHPINISCLLPPASLLHIMSNSTLADPLYPVLLNVPSTCVTRLISPPPYEPPPPSVPELATDPLVSQPELSSALEAAMSATISHTASCTTEQTAGTNPQQSSMSLSLSVEIPPHQQVSWSLQSSSHVSPLAEPKEQTASLSIGNLYMSSCPGKKVRLDGPVNGRSAVCRDLGMDMARMKALGVGCIVCCLDEEELDLLGAPWAAYQSSAQALGIDVLRLPIPEGLPPISPAYLDTHLTRLLNDYTLKGTPVLVHCRGGVGRAGVVACCWLIRLGLCGWTVTTSQPSDQDAAAVVEENGETRPPSETIKLVESVISFLRERRNPKAVETSEQVQFLVDYVEYLRNQNADP